MKTRGPETGTRRPEPGTRNPETGNRGRESGFTLIEVMLALAVLGMAAVMILDQRVDVVRAAASAKEARMTWVLASRKIAELELDKTLWAGTGGSSNGDFGELDPEYAGFTWEYQALREPVEVQDPLLLKPGSKPKEIFRLTLAVRAPGSTDPVLLEAQFPVTDLEAPAAEEPKPPGAIPETPAPPPGEQKP